MSASRKRWLPLALTTSAALALWALAATSGYGWQMIWLPATMAGAFWPSKRRRALRGCLRVRPNRER
jgi:hypothetical protein